MGHLHIKSLHPLKSQSSNTTGWPLLQQEHSLWFSTYQHWTHTFYPLMITSLQVVLTSKVKKTCCKIRPSGDQLLGLMIIPLNLSLTQFSSVVSLNEIAPMRIFNQKRMMGYYRHYCFFSPPPAQAPAVSPEGIGLASQLQQRASALPR